MMNDVPNHKAFRTRPVFKVVPGLHFYNRDWQKNNAVK